MKKYIIILLIGASLNSNAQSTELELELLNALYDCRADYYLLADKYVKLDSIVKIELLNLRGQLEQAKTAAKEAKEANDKAASKEKKRQKKKNYINIAIASSLAFFAGFLVKVNS